MAVNRPPAAAVARRRSPLGCAEYRQTWKKNVGLSISETSSIAEWLGVPACYEQAMLRYSNCLVGRQIPPLNY
jgi:hypothetical protein